VQPAPGAVSPEPAPGTTERMPEIPHPAPETPPVKKPSKPPAHHKSPALKPDAGVAKPPPDPNDMGGRL
jgi:hypothetical protein